MRLLHVTRSEQGSASLEFIVAGVLLMVPLVYLTLVLGRVQAGTLAAESLARQAARVYVTAPTTQLAASRVAMATADTLADFHFTAREGGVTISCSPATTPCLRSQSWVSARSRIDVTLPFVPAILGLEKYAQITVSASATERVALGAGQ
ncbi:MAG: hypothetical protein RLZZ600_1095 [Actinomycetota bacterium]|jgi:glutamyl-tRNA reductase